MCIRDRSGLADTLFHPVLIANSSFGCSDTATTTVLVHPAPVSYTHLRAHETVLELVCRLLLEKKKQKLNDPKSVIC